MKNAIIMVNKLCKSFSNGGIQQHILRNIDLQIYSGDFTVIMGASGSGKSTLLYALSGMDRPSLGEVYFGNQNITAYSNDKLAVFRRKHCGFVFQQIYLMDNMSILDNVLASGLLVHKNKKQVFNCAQNLLNGVGLTETEWVKFPKQLSGGELQRAGVVRALINKPEVVFTDEPTGALNSASGKRVLDLLTKAHEEGQSIVMVTHDLKSARRGNRVIYLQDGKICGECDLGLYVSGNKDRHAKLNTFLAEMRW